MEQNKNHRLFFIPIFVCLLAGCGEKEKIKNPADAQKSGMAATEQRLYPVRVSTVKTQLVTYEVQAIGSVEAQDVYHVVARVAGTLYDVNFNEGDEIKEDKILCKIAPEAYRFANLKAKALYDQAVAVLNDTKRSSVNAIARAKIDLARASIEIARRKGFEGSGTISKEEIQLFEAQRDQASVSVKDQTEAAETVVKTLEASIAEKEAAWRIAEDDLRKSTVNPPIAGTIEKRWVTNMVYATPGMELATIVDRRKLKLKFKVAERDAAAVKEGGKVTFTVPAFTNRKFEAAIYHIESLLDRDARTLTCWANVTQDAALLKPGFFASVNIVTQVKEQAIVVPSAAVLPTEKGFIAFVIKDIKDVKNKDDENFHKEGKAELRQVVAGLSVTENSIEILSGLALGEQLVIEGSNALQKDSPVKLLETAKATDSASTKAPREGTPK